MRCCRYAALKLQCKRQGNAKGRLDRAVVPGCSAFGAEDRGVGWFCAPRAVCTPGSGQQEGLRRSESLVKLPGYSAFSAPSRNDARRDVRTSVRSRPWCGRGEGYAIVTGQAGSVPLRHAENIPAPRRQCTFVLVRCLPRVLSSRGGRENSEWRGRGFLRPAVIFGDGTLVPASALEEAAVTEAAVAAEPTAVAQETEEAPVVTAGAPAEPAPAEEPAETEEQVVPPEADVTEAPAVVAPEVTDAPVAPVAPEVTEGPPDVPAEAPTEAAAEPEAEAPAAPTQAAVAPAQAEDAAAEPTVQVESPEEGMSTGQVVGIVFGSLLAIIVLNVVVVTVFRRMGRYSSRKKPKKSKAQENILVSPLRRKTGKKEKEVRPVFWKRF
ncbi:hypothetical protein COCON_G00140180 [Conger conger]|uniref:Uncharacterized protein n=1 Tax=Conger conger TaxID=82655 RepID=A0A9Q1HV01_CONCO|nr:hypothetical protein COCON_G00140180 [Conger conger]